MRLKGLEMESPFVLSVITLMLWHHELIILDAKPVSKNWCQRAEVHSMKVSRVTC